MWYYLTHSWEDKGVHTFPKSICPKVNVIARLEYELAYYDFAVHRCNDYTTATPPPRMQFIELPKAIFYIGTCARIDLYMWPLSVLTVHFVLSKLKYI